MTTFKYLLCLSLFAADVRAQLPIPTQPPDAPESLRPPASEHLLLHAVGQGDQVYVCKAVGGQYAWTLKAPDARLLNEANEVIGHHFAGPTWQASDGSAVVGRVSAAAASPDPDSIPWLLLSATAHSGNGLMTPVLSIQRLSTKGGKAPSAGCDAAHSGAEMHAAYSADYYFYAATQPTH